MSSNYRQVALRIPAKHRRYIIEENLIYKAIATVGDIHMEQLRVIWAATVDPHGENDPYCIACLTRILKNYQEMETTLIALIKEEELLNL